MVIVLITSIIALILVYFQKHVCFKQSKITLLGLAFTLITILQAIHYNYGSDYINYYNNYLLYKESSSVSQLLFLKSIGSGAFKDMGWVLINWLMPEPNGFFLLIIIISIIENIIYYKLIKAYTDKRHWWKSLAIYLFVTSYYVLNYSAIRQGFAVSLCILSIMLVLDDRIMSSLAVAVFAVTIHSSALVMIPFIVTSKLPLKNGCKYGTTILFISVVLFLGNTIVWGIFEHIIDLIPFLGNHYAHYVEDIPVTEKSLGLGFVLHSVMYMVLIYHVIVRFNEYSHNQRVVILLTCISYCIIPFQLTISGLVSRIGTYFSVFQIVAVPMVYSKIKDSMLRLGVGFIYVFMMLHGYYRFFFVTQWSSESFAEFQTIFSVLFNY